jgi:hypothetical protein
MFIYCATQARDYHAFIYDGKHHHVDPELTIPETDPMSNNPSSSSSHKPSPQKASNTHSPPLPPSPPKWLPRSPLATHRRGTKHSHRTSRVCFRRSTRRWWRLRPLRLLLHLPARTTLSRARALRRALLRAKSK